MNKKFLFTILIIILIMVITTSAIVLALSPGVRSQIRSCQKDCYTISRVDFKSCSLQDKTCRSSCIDEYKSCLLQLKDQRIVCKNDCGLSSNNSITQRQCTKECNSEYYKSRRNACDYRTCKNSCRETKKICKSTTLNNQNECRNLCVPSENNTITYYEYLVPESDCQENGGLFQPLCRGPHFRISCSREDYCQCDGYNNYTCPQNFECVKDHGIKLRGRGNSYQGWRDMLGLQLGDIGICAQQKLITINNTDR